MTLAQLRQLCRATIPTLKVSVADNTTLDLVINEAVKDIAAYTLCLKSNKKFNIVASQSGYNLSTVIGDYLVVDKSGLWHYNGSQWRQLYPRTLKYLDEYSPTWRDLAAGTPQYYFIEGDILTLSPKPSTAGTNYLWLYYAKKPTAMTQDTHFPFSGSTSEFTHLSIFDMAITKYVKWILDPVLNKDQEANLSYQEYVRERQEKFLMFSRRKDIAHDSDTRMSGPSVRR